MQEHSGAATIEVRQVGRAVQEANHSREAVAHQQRMDNSSEIAAAKGAGSFAAKKN